jgi:MAF protein
MSTRIMRPARSLKFLLASSSPYRYKLLQQLIPQFEKASPDIDESALNGESAEQLVSRLSQQKALALQAEYPNHVIIASDQVAVFGNQSSTILTKPLNEQKAFEQLKQCSGKQVRFLTGLSVIAPSYEQRTEIDKNDVQFRHLSDEQIKYYIKEEKPLDCAGSFKVEALGISLFTELTGKDPNALVGLPLITLNQILCDFGIDTLA